VTKKPKIPKSLQRTFDQRSEAMQTVQSKAAAKALFQATPEELGRAAVKGAKRTREQTPEQIADAAKIDEDFSGGGGPGTPEYIQVVVEQEAGQTLLAWKSRRTLGLEGLSPEDRRAEEERLAADPSSAKKPIGKAVLVKENIPTWIYAGGWCDGPGWLHKGVQIWLEEESDGLVDYINGPRPLGPGEHRGGGFFPASYLSHCEDL
jgi:hypothetical protein